VSGNTYIVFHAYVCLYVLSYEYIYIFIISVKAGEKAVDESSHQVMLNLRVLKKQRKRRVCVSMFEQVYTQKEKLREKK
jgi:hypothetical protein